MTQHNGHYRTLLPGLPGGIPALSTQHPAAVCGRAFTELRPVGPCPKRQIERRFLMNMLALLALTFAACDDQEAVEKAVAKAAAYESYAFKGETEFQSQFGNLPGQVPSMDGKYQKDAGMHIKTERGEF